MKTIKCDRCGKTIPYIPIWENMANISNVNSIVPKLRITVWNTNTQKLNEIDLCDSCQDAVYGYIFNFNGEDDS